MKVIIDRDITGWPEDTEYKLDSYEEIRRVGKDEELAQRSSDKKLGTFCKDNDYHFITGDNGAHVHFFEDQRIKNLNISQIDWWKTADRPIFLIKILD